MRWLLRRRRPRWSGAVIMGLQATVWLRSSLDDVWLNHASVGTCGRWERDVEGEALPGEQKTGVSSEGVRGWLCSHVGCSSAWPGIKATQEP